MKNFLLALIPIFVAMDAIGVLPIFLSLTEGMDPKERERVVKASVVTGFAVGVGFLLIGKFVFRVIGVTVSDFKVAGGLILLVLAIYDLIFPEKTRRSPGETVGVVPLG
ncbi:MAG: MarC family protein, partial [Deltaproteobacteria bacterium]